MNGQAAAAVTKANPVFWQKKMQREGMHGISYERRDYELVNEKTIRATFRLASVGVTPRIFPTFKIAEKQEELESSVLQWW